jgi:hypothetical protein
MAIVTMDTKSAIFIALALTCILYAIVLESLHDKYVPNWIVLTVIVGEGFILEALALIEHYGYALTSWDMFFGQLAAGIPITVWQVYQVIARKQERHSGATPRREAADRSDRSA